MQVASPVFVWREFVTVGLDYLIQSTCRERAQLFTSTHCVPFSRHLEYHIEPITFIVSSNFYSGRAQRIMNKTCAEVSSDGYLVKYVDHVITYYLAHSVFICRLQAGDTDSWQGLYTQLYKSACKFLQRQASAQAWISEEASDYTQQACTSIYRTFYPFDVPFEAWAKTVLFNCIRQRHRSPDLLNRTRDVVSLDEVLAATAEQSEMPRHEYSCNARDSRAFERIEERDKILSAIAQLRSAAQRTVITYAYLDELCDTQIAQKLETSAANVQLLRHRALRNLMRILSSVDDS
jgi:RNA polymerase sigma factor (sigma-70 family)